MPPFGNIPDKQRATVPVDPGEWLTWGNLGGPGEGDAGKRLARLAIISYVYPLSYVKPPSRTEPYIPPFVRRYIRGM